MIYSGVANGNPRSANKIGTGTQIKKYPYNHTYNDNAYVGYMMGIPLNGTGTSGNTTSSNSTSYSKAHTNSYNSDIKSAVDSWYRTNINSKSSLTGKNYSTYLDSEVGFCNDREINNAGYYSGNGAGKSQTGYASWGRLISNRMYLTIQIPTLKCTNKSRDLFTIGSSKIGNKKLTYPVGLITIDEVVYAGGFGGKDNSNYYLYTGENYWSMSPSNCDNNAYVLGVNNYGSLAGGGTVHFANGVRPVINLKANTKMTGTGAYSDPFVVQN